MLGRASVCSFALIAAGSCERASGSGGVKRPRSGAAGALDAAARERIMPGGRGGELLMAGMVKRSGRVAFLYGVTSRGGRGGRGAASLT